MAEQGSPGPRGRPLVVTVFNQKGGIGKTTTSVNLSVALAALGRRVALIDLDSQGNATSSLGMTAAPAAGAYRLVTDTASLAAAMAPTAFAGLWLCPASDELVGADIELAMDDEPHGHLRRAIRAVPTDLDVVVIDCPPALGLLPVNAMVASDLALLPVAPEPLAREGLLKAWRHLHRIRANLNPSLQVLGVLLTMVDKSAVHREFAATVRAEFGARVLPLVVPRDPAILAASALEVPVAVYDPDCAAARAYVELAHLLLHGGGTEGAGWAEARAQAPDHAAARAVLLAWRAEVLRDAPPPPAASPREEPEEQEEPARPPPRSRGLGMLLLGLALGLVLGAALPALLARLS